MRSDGAKARARSMTGSEVTTGIPGDTIDSSLKGGMQPVGTTAEGFKYSAGEAAKKRLDKYARGGVVKPKGKSNINIIINAGEKKPDAAAMPMPPMPMPAAPPPPPPAPAGGPPGGGQAPPPPELLAALAAAGKGGGAPAGPAPGQPPMMPPGKARGGRVGAFKHGGAVKSVDGTEQGKNAEKNMGPSLGPSNLARRYKCGGEVKMTAGKGSGEGRLQAARKQRGCD